MNKKLSRLTQLHQERCEIIGLDLADPENGRTPERCARADVEQFFCDEVFNFTVFPNKDYDQMLVKPRIHFSSMCSHHLYPYFGTCDIGYIPKDKIPGLSKLPRLVKHLTKGASSQEWVSQRIADFLWEKLEPKGVIVVLKARHTCESCRGVRNQSPDSVFITSAVKGVFTESAPRMEFFHLMSL